MPTKDKLFKHQCTIAQDNNVGVAYYTKCIILTIVIRKRRRSSSSNISSKIQNIVMSYSLNSPSYHNI